MSGCIITADGTEPEERGWPTAPFPTATNGTFPPAGWTWLGWGYNGSPALAAWEASLVRNAASIGVLKAGQVRAFPEALPLWEGFLAEIQARGYTILNGGTYVFRCTATTRKDCAGFTRSSLSNHAYGLASDLNISQNPLKTYLGINGASACSTPMLTDMPRWVVQVAEKWGLYWGGYGWSSGCSSPQQFKSTAYRDPMHFEFNGTPAEAIAIARHNSGGTCLDVADTVGTITTRCFQPDEVPPAGLRTVIDTEAPAGASVALVNITAVGATQPGFVTAESCGALSAGGRTWSNANIRPGRTVAAVAFVPVDSEGRFCLFQSTAMHAIVDVQGYFTSAASAPGGSTYHPVRPARVTDTRSRVFCTPDSTCFESGLVAAGTELVHFAAASVDATAVLANLTVPPTTANGYLTADACSSLTPGPQQRSNLNASTGNVTANLAVIAAQTTEQGAQFCTLASTATQQIVDVYGVFAPATSGGWGYEPATPTRLVDTRGCRTDAVTGAQQCGTPTVAGGVVRLRAPAGASAAVVNVTAIQPGGPGFVSVGACRSFIGSTPASSNVNAIVGANVANLAVVPVGSDGVFCVYTSSAMHLAVDVMGTFRPGGSLRYAPTTPVRVHDSRQLT